MRFCPWAERSVLYAAAKGIEVEIVNINLADKPEWYFDKHPQGKVPAFEKDGKVVIESSIIPEYLDGIYTESAILPANPYLRAKQRILLDQAAPITSAFYGFFAVYREHLEGEERAAKLKAVVDAVDVVEKLLKEDYFVPQLVSLTGAFCSALGSALAAHSLPLSDKMASSLCLSSDGQLAFFESIGRGKADYDVGF